MHTNCCETDEREAELQGPHYIIYGLFQSMKITAGIIKGLVKRRVSTQSHVMHRVAWIEGIGNWG